jgi:hypothetical protein
VRGVRSRIASAAAEAADILPTEQRIYASVCKRKVSTRSRIDVVELWADMANITRRASKFGLVASQPFGFRYDVTIRPNDPDVWSFVHMCDPLLIVMAVPCTVWSTLNWNINYLFRRRELIAKQEKELHQIRLAVAMAYHQLKRSRFFLIENPASSRIWRTNEAIALMNTKGVYVATGHGCVWGLRGVGGGLLRKTWRFYHQRCRVGTCFE